LGLHLIVELTHDELAPTNRDGTGRVTMVERFERLSLEGIDKVLDQNRCLSGDSGRGFGSRKVGSVSEGEDIFILHGSQSVLVDINKTSFTGKRAVLDKVGRTHKRSNVKEVVFPYNFFSSIKVNKDNLKVSPGSWWVGTSRASPLTSTISCRKWVWRFLD
jgi:hypothetical protein